VTPQSAAGPDVHGLADFDLVIFGGTGDLALRKLLPAMYYRHREAADPGSWRIVCCGRRAMTRDEYRSFARDHCKGFIPAADYVEADWAGFASCVDYLAVDAEVPTSFAALAEALNRTPPGATAGAPVPRIRVFYLSTAALLFAPICANLAAQNLITESTRVVLEKPLGNDLQSSHRINNEVARYVAEHQIFRIDHYLGKEAVQNLIALRFGNAIFEPLWNRSWIRDVQITLAEQVGVEARGDYYDSAGALRDMVQNHLLQLLCIIAMEPPSSLDPDAVRDEKLKVLRSLRPFTPGHVRAKVVRGQYRAGAIDGAPVPSYLEEADIPAGSHTETYVALKAELDTWRWAGVPFFLRTGKRMQERLAEIVVNFRKPPLNMLPGAGPDAISNQLVIRLQPDEWVKLFLNVKVPGAAMAVQPVHLDLDFSRAFRMRQWDAYERLLSDVIEGRLTLFMRRDEVDAAWQWIDPIHAAWTLSDEPPKLYAAGTWGPTAASALLARDELAWKEES